MTDIMKLIARLREPECENHDVGATGVSVELLDWDVLDDAADAIEALQGEVERLKTDGACWKQLHDEVVVERDALQAKLAKQAGFDTINDKVYVWAGQSYIYVELERFAKLVRNAALDEAAQICDRFQDRDVGMQPAECAGAIRNLKEPTP